MTWFGLGAALGGGMAIGDALGSALGKLVCAGGGQSSPAAQPVLKNQRQQIHQRATAYISSQPAITADPDVLLDEKLLEYLIHFPDLRPIPSELRLTSADFERIEGKYREFYNSRFGRL